MEYSHQKYHKNDFTSLEQWFDDSVKSCCTPQSAIEVAEQLNQLYGVYLCAWKEMIRLFYIESAEKALLVEKLFYSMIRLFGGMISQQQDMFRQWKRERSADTDSLN